MIHEARVGYPSLPNLPPATDPTMLHAQLLDIVRDTVRTAFAQQGLASCDDLSESIMIRDGYYCGRSFTCGGLRAVWFAEENLLKFFGHDNRLLYSQPAVSEADLPDRNAA